MQQLYNFNYSLSLFKFSNKIVANYLGLKSKLILTTTIRQQIISKLIKVNKATI